VPDLSAAGYRFMGGRLVPTPHGPAALFLYDDDRGTRVAMLVRPMPVDGSVPMAAETRGMVAGVTWADQGLGYGLVAAAAPALLRPLADAVRRQAAPL
jgi:anti-sigma factor RsiW